MRKLLSCVAIGLALYLGAQPDEHIRRRVELLTAGSEVLIDTERIYCKNLLPEFYQGRQFELAWTAKDKGELIEILNGADEEGLNASDYHLDAIGKFNKSAKPIEVAELDLLLTDAFLLYASHFLNGKVNPETVDSEWKAMRREGNAREFLENALATNDIKENLQGLEPRHPGYNGLKYALAEYKSIKAKGGWMPIPDGDALKAGMVDTTRVPLVISRLLATKDLNNRPANEFTYSEKISDAIKLYQSRNGLDADGNLGKMTLSSLNVPVEKRIDQIKINIERYRWISQELGNHYVLVNIADYQLQVYKEGNLTYQDKVIVGKPFRKTPVFSSRMTYMVINPTWTIPPTILFNDILPEVKKNPEYLNTKNIRVLQGQGSNLTILDPHSIDWSVLSKVNFPYTLRQDPGPTNALGAVKFMFPNSYNVYIHDTPSKELFTRPDRAFSSGCIRLNNPIAFANYLLNGDPNWNEELLKKELNKGDTKSIMLLNPLNVHILYLTSWIHEGEVQFRPDLYDRDQPVLNALNSKPPSI